MLAIVFVMLTGGLARADDPPRPPAAPPAAPVAPVAKPAPPPTPEQAADAVLAAVQAKDDAALKALAAKDAPDPWVVADELIGRGMHDAASAFAEAAPRVDVEKLPEYVAAQRKETDVPAIRLAARTATALLRKGDAEGALAGLAALPSGSDDVPSVRCDTVRGMALERLHRLDECIAVFRDAASRAERIGWINMAGGAWYQAGRDAQVLRDHDLALQAYGEDLRLERLRGDRRREAAALMALGVAHQERGQGDQADARLTEARGIYESLHDLKGVGSAIGNLANGRRTAGDFAGSLRLQQESLRVLEEAHATVDALITRLDIASVYGDLGDRPRQVEWLARLVPDARAAGHAVLLATALSDLGQLYAALGDPDRAQQALTEGLEAGERSGDPYLRAKLLRQLGMVAMIRDESDEAEAFARRALEIYEARHDPAGAAEAWAVLADVLMQRGKHDEGVDAFRRVLSLVGESDARTAGYCRVRIADVLFADKKYAEGRETVERGVADAERAGADATVARGNDILCQALVMQDDARAALLPAHRAVEAVERFAKGYADEMSAGVRGDLSHVFRHGARAAAKLDDTEELLFFLETGRAGALREALGGRRALASVALPEDLGRLDAEARNDEARARQALAVAQYEKDRPEIARRRGELEAAIERRRVAIESLQRHAKSIANVLDLRPSSKSDLQSGLAPNEALVLYGRADPDLIALVLTRTGERIIGLGPLETVRAACGAFAPDDRTASPAAAAEELAELLVRPLALAAGTTRVLISPEGPLAYVPFSLLFLGREVVSIPSATTWRLLASERERQGNQVLALGDPAYAEVSRVDVPALASRGGRLQRLPGTRAEVDAIADVRVLGEDATRAGLLQALAKQGDQRWTAVHFACHGLLDALHPELSALALAPTPDDDGIVTARDLFRTKVSADLVVLSACNTGRGKVVEGEGVIGLVRAFMFAGSPRVICSLWKVDDAATKALMVKFYELWNPKDGSKPMGTAAALKAAQDFVKSQPKWKHPSFWAAWVLWGLPE